jgi:hypothetical protein
MGAKEEAEAILLAGPHLIDDKQVPIFLNIVLDRLQEGGPKGEANQKQERNFREIGP